MSQRTEISGQDLALLAPLPPPPPAPGTADPGQAVFRRSWMSLWKMGSMWREYSEPSSLRKYSSHSDLVDLRLERRWNLEVFDSQISVCGETSP